MGEKFPQFTLAGSDLSEITNETIAGRTVIYNIFPSIDTGVCAQSVREFNEKAAGLSGVSVVCVSADLPFAHQRFCAAEGIENVLTGSTFRSDFARESGLEMADGPLAGLLARAVVVADAEGTVRYVELVDEIGSEPNYEAALQAAQQ